MEIARQLIESYLPLCTGLSSFDQLGSEKYPIPTISDKNKMYDLLKLARGKFSKDPTLLRLQKNIYIVGDLHGNIRDLLRIFTSTRPPPFSKFLFLGDYVDRGHFSIEVVSLLISLSLIYPENIFLLRGNHEFSRVNETYGFKDEVLQVYNNDSLLWECFNEFFRELPIAALIGDDTFCVHGGISSQLCKIEQVQYLPRPISDDDGLVMDLMWSDPNDSIDGFCPSTRGNGCNFGSIALQLFLERNKLQRIIRGHQLVMKGISISYNGRLVTVFSTSDYEKNYQNDCGIVKIEYSGEILNFFLERMPTLAREEVVFQQIEIFDPIPMPVAVSIKTYNPYVRVCPSISKIYKARQRGSMVKGSTSAVHIGGLLTDKSRRHSISEDAFGMRRMIRPSLSDGSTSILPALNTFSSSILNDSDEE